MPRGLLVCLFVFKKAIGLKWPFKIQLCSDIWGILICKGSHGGRESHFAFQGELEIMVLKETVWCCVPGAVHIALPCKSSNEYYFYKDQGTEA